MNELAELISDGYYVEMSKDGDMYVVKRFKKGKELAVQFGRSESLPKAILIVLEKKQDERKSN